MTFPKKHTRPISVDNVKYVWHLNAGWETKNSWITIAGKGCENNQLLLVDPYHHDTLPSPGTVTAAIRYALNNGWDPLCKGKPVRLAYNGKSFEILPDGIKDWEHHKEKKYLQ